MWDSVSDENFNLYDFSREYKWEKEGIEVARVEGITSVWASKRKPALGTFFHFSFSG